MKILAIRGANLASLARDFEIDLSHGALATSGLFAIVGNTGAGKSTLLDAMCVALFDRTPRIGDRQRTPVLIGRGSDDAAKVGAHDVRSLLRRGAGRGYAEVDFSGNDGRVYRARWEVHRARDRAEGALQAQEMSLVALEGGERLGGTKTETLAAIEDKLGLSFDQFRRSALLAQGDFAAFLRADARDRSELLERMTGTEIYSQLSIAAHKRGQAAEARLKELGASLGAIEVLPEAERAALHDELAHAQLAHDTARADVAEAERALEWHQRRLHLRQELEQAVRELAGVREQEALAGALRAEHDQRRRAEGLRAPWQAAERAARLGRERATQVDATRRAAERAAAASASAEQALLRIEEVLGPVRALRESLRLPAPASALGGAPEPSLEHLAARAPEPLAYLGERRHLHGLAAAWPELQALGERELALRQSAAEQERKAQRLLEELDRQGQRREALELERQRARRDLDEARRKAAIAAGPSGGERPQVSLDQASRALDAAQRGLELAEALGAVRDEARAAAAELDELAERRALAEEVDVAAERELAALAARGPVVAAELAQAEAALTRLTSAASLAHARAGLTEGEPCPLCGAREHPWAGRGAFDEVIVAQEAVVAELRGRRDDDSRARGEAEARRQAARATQAELEQARRDAEARRQAAAERWSSALLALGELALVTDPAAPGAEALAKEHAARARRTWEKARDERRRVDALTKAINDANSLMLTKQHDLSMVEVRVAEAEAERLMLEERRGEAVRAAAEQRAARGELLGALAARVEPFGVTRETVVAEPARVLEELRGGVAAWRRHVERLLELEAALARHHERSTAAAARAQTEQAVAETSLATYQAELREAEHAATVAADELVRACAAAELSAEQLTALMAAPPERVHELGELLAEVVRRGERARSIVDERRRALAEHERAAPPAATAHAGAAPTKGDARAEPADGDQRERQLGLRLAQAHASARDAARQAEERALALRARLERDDLDLQRRQAVQAQVTAAEKRGEVDRALAQAIGSHDGKLLRAFAQSLTLDTLLDLANQHLDELAPRYQLERVPRYDLELQVIDRDMGEEVRAVQSLSGGESFLVSLALALALSSLAAGSVRVRTLLIDEGFGTLDASTLDSALAMLDALQATGRQVGIISHIPGLVERVAAHVRVVQRGNGRSEVVVSA